MTSDTAEAVFGCFDRTSPCVGNALAVIEGFQFVHLATFKDLLGPLAELRSRLVPPRGDRLAVCSRLLGVQHEWCCEFDLDSIGCFETVVVQRGKIDELCVFQPCLTVAVVPFPTKLDSIEAVFILVAVIT